MLPIIVRFYVSGYFLGIDKIAKAIAAIKCFLLLNMQIDFSNMPFHLTELYNQYLCDILGYCLQ